MARRLLTIARIALAYALLGLLTSVAVAWGLAWGINVESRPLEQATLVIEEHVIAAAGGDAFGKLPFPYSALSQRRSFGSYRRSLEFTPVGADIGWTPMFAPSHPSMSWLPGTFSVETFVDSLEPDQHWLPQWTYAVPDNGMWGRVYSFDGDVSRDVFVLEDARGFPALCLWSDWERKPDWSLRAAGGIQLPPSNSSPFVGLPDPLGGRVLPYRPIWAGLVFNTAFYAVVFWLGVRTFKGLRGWRRFSRGLCPACAYDLCFDYSRGCSECGRGTGRTV